MSEYMAIFREIPPQKIYVREWSVLEAQRHNCWNFAVANDAKRAEALLREKLREHSRMLREQADMLMSASNIELSEAGQ